ncbi:MAG: hypothetical protein ABI589_14870, partial [Burkholderiales bacterium]
MSIEGEKDGGKAIRPRRILRRAFHQVGTNAGKALDHPNFGIKMALYARPLSFSSYKHHSDRPQSGAIFSVRRRRNATQRNASRATQPQPQPRR